jgi:ribonuclease HI
MEAIQFALDKDATDITVFYDCHAIEYWARKSSLAISLRRKNHEFYEKYNRFIRAARKQLYINFKKVPAHSDVELNNLADSLAKYAQRAQLPPTITDFNPLQSTAAKRFYQDAA